MSDDDFKYLCINIVCPSCKLRGWWTKIDPSCGDTDTKLLFRCQECKNILTINIKCTFEHGE